MGRHSLPDQYGAGGSDPRRSARRRTTAVAAVLVLTVVAGAGVALEGGLLPLGSSCQDDPVRLTVAASPDLAPALRAAAQRARAADLTSDGRCVAVTVRPRESYEVADTLLAGEDPGAEVWVPDSEVWIQRLTQDGGPVDVTTVGQVATTPVGVAMLPAAAESLGWPKKTYGWLELAEAGLGGDSLRLGAADPARSATGLLALTRLSASAAQAEAGQARTGALMKALSQRISEGDGQLLDTLTRAGSDTGQGDDPSRNQALVVSEQTVFAYNSGAGGSSRGNGDGPGDGVGTGGDGDGNGGSRSLNLFYPQDGSPRLDYPYTLLDQTGLTTDESRAAIRFMSYLRDPGQLRLLERHGFRTSEGVVPEALVARAGGKGPQPYGEPPGRPVSASALQEALGVWTITVRSARITTVVDASASMSEPVPGTGKSRMEVTKASLLQALATFKPDDEIGLWDFAAELDGDTRTTASECRPNGSAIVRTAGPSATLCRRRSTTWRRCRTARPACTTPRSPRTGPRPPPTPRAGSTPWSSSPTE